MTFSYARTFEEAFPRPTYQPLEPRELLKLLASGVPIHEGELRFQAQQIARRLLELEGDVGALGC